MKIKSLFNGLGSGFGTFFSVGCPACIPTIGGMFSALGLGFLINMSILKPLTAVLLFVGLFGLYSNFKKHKYKIFLITGAIASFTVFASRYIIEFQPSLYAAAGVIFLNAILDYKYAKRCACCAIKYEVIEKKLKQK